MNAINTDVVKFSATLIGEANNDVLVEEHMVYYPVSHWFCTRSKRIFQISEAALNGDFEIFGCDLLGMEPCYEYSNFRSSPNQTILGNLPFRTSVQPIYYKNWFRTLMIVDYFSISIIQIIVFDSILEEGIWKTTLITYDIENCQKFFEIFKGLNGEIVMRVYQEGIEKLKIFEANPLTDGNFVISFVGDISLTDIPYLYRFEPLMYRKIGQVREMRTYFLSSYVRFSDDAEKFSVVKCIKKLNQINQPFSHHVVKFPHNRYITETDEKFGFKPVHIEALQYWVQQLIPKSILIIKRKLVVSGCVYRVEIKRLF